MTDKSPNADRDAVLDRWALGMTAKQIADGLGLKRPAVVSNIIQRAREVGDPRAECRGSPYDMAIIKFGIVRRSPVGDAFLQAASRRNISPNELARRIVSTVVADNLIDAVLDDGR